MRTVAREYESYIGGRSVGKILELANISWKNCLRVLNYRYFIWGPNRVFNLGIRIFAEHYFNVRATKCVDNIDLVFTKSISQISDENRKIAKVLASKLKTDLSEAKIYTVVEETPKSIAPQASMRKLERLKLSFTFVVMNVGIVDELNKYSNGKVSKSKMSC